MPVRFEDKTVNYRIKTKGQSVSGRTNEMTWSLMKDRYVVIRNFIPEDIIEMALDMWRADEQFGGAYTEREVKDITYKNPEESIGKSKGGYCTTWGIALHGYIHNKLKDYIDMDLRETYSYTRKYERGAYLGSHTDRPSCEVSVTMNIDSIVDWPIQLQDLEGNRQKVVTPIGHGLAYSGIEVPHWRTPLKAKEGTKHMQSFFHYVRKNGKYADYAFDKNAKCYHLLTT